MPNCKFYAAGSDYEEILKFVFSEMHCKVYQKYSDPDSELIRFKSAREVIKHYNLKSETPGSGKLAHLMLWPVDASNNFKATKLTLNPNKSKGATYRYQAEGMGLIQIELNGMSAKGLECSRTHHITEKRARAWEIERKHDLGLASAWNWRLIDNISGQLNNFIKHKSKKKIGAMPVMTCAETLALAETK